MCQHITLRFRISKGFGHLPRASIINDDHFVADVCLHHVNCQLSLITPNKSQFLLVPVAAMFALGAVRPEVALVSQQPDLKLGDVHINCGVRPVVTTFLDEMIKSSKKNAANGIHMEWFLEANRTCAAD